MQSPAIFGGMNHLNAQQGMMNRLTHQHAYASSQHSNGVMTAGNSPDTNTSSLEFGAPRPPPNHQPQRPQETASGSMPHASHSGFHDRNHYHHQQQQQQHASQPGAMPNGDMYGKHSNGVIDGPNGLITPIQSGEIMASNMNLQMGSNGNSNSMHPPGSAHAPPEGGYAINYKGEVIFTPLLSPAITQPSDSKLPSPLQFERHEGGLGQSTNHKGPPHDPESHYQAQLYELQQKQKQIQDQLDEISRTHPSPFISPMMHAQMNGGDQSVGSQGQGSIRSGVSNLRTPTSHTTPNSDFFSPLTSPALNPVKGHHPHQQHPPTRVFRQGTSTASGGSGTGDTQPDPSSSGGFGSVLSSPFLNGTPMMRASHHDRRGSNSLEQTLSPALLPQPESWMPQTQGHLSHQSSPQQPMNAAGLNVLTSQSYVDELARMINCQDNQVQQTGGANQGDMEAQQQQQQQQQHSQSARQAQAGPSSTSSRKRASTVGKSPRVRPSRSSLGRTRPSPMMKPTQRPGRGGSSTVPPSPLVSAFSATSPVAMPAALARANGAPHGQQGGDGLTSNDSHTSDSLSPVDLSQMIMPPPPPPLHAPISSGTVHSIKNGAHVAPITPSALMQLGPAAFYHSKNSGMDLGASHMNSTQRAVDQLPPGSDFAEPMNAEDANGHEILREVEMEPPSGSTSRIERPKLKFQQLSAKWSATLKAIKPTGKPRFSSVEKPACADDQTI